MKPSLFSARRPRLSNVILLIWGVFVIQLLSFCGGKESGGGAGIDGGAGTGGGAGTNTTGSAGTLGGGGTSTISTTVGFGGHTSTCMVGACLPSCFNWPACLGDAGIGGNMGRGGDGGFAGSGFAGHTGSCLGKCQPGCPPSFCAGNGGNGGDAGRGGSAGFSGTAGIGGTGFGGHTSSCPQNCGCSGFPPCPVPDAGNDANRDAADRDGAPDAPMMSKAAGADKRACYGLAGYEADPCLPADDMLLSWLNGPSDCVAHVTAGPSIAFDGKGRACCYSVACE
jgi:hypothetical protein